MQVIIASEQQNPMWLYGSTYAYLRIYASTDFYTSDGISITAGQVGSPNWYQQYTCTVSGTTLTIPQVTLQSTTDSTVEAATYTAVLFDSRGTQRNIKLQNFRVDPSLAPASTWQALAMENVGISLSLWNQTWSIPQIVGYIDTRIGTSTTPYASSIVVGKSYLDTDPVVPTDPIAVASNSNRLTKNLSSDYSNSFATAILDIGGTEATLLVKDAVTVSSSTSIPANIQLRFEGAGIVTVTNTTFTVGSMLDPNNKQCFVLSGTGSVVFGSGSVDAINVAWFGSVGDCTAAINNAIASFTTVGDGGVIYIPQGAWITDGNHTLPSNVSVVGDGKTVTTLTASGNANQILGIGANTYNVLVKDITLDGDNHTITAFLCTAAYGDGSSGQLRFEAVTFKNSTHGFRILDTLSTEWQVAQASFDAQCVFTDNTYGVYCNSTNNTVQCDAFFEVADNQWAGYFERAGQWTFKGNEFAGSAYTGANQIETNTVVAAAGITGNGTAQSVVTATNMVGSPATVSVPVTTAMTTATLIADAFREALGNNPSVTSYFHIGGTGASIQLIAIDKNTTDAGNINFTINTGTATGITNSLTSTETISGLNPTSQQARGFYFGNSHGVATFVGTVDEGFSEFIVNDSEDLNSVITLLGSTVQGNISLNASCQLNTSCCSIADRAIRDGASSGTQYNSIGDSVSNTFYLSGAFRTLSARKTNNFAGSSVSGSSDTAFSINPARNLISSQYPIRSYQNENLFGQSTSQAQGEFLTSLDGSPHVRVGRCTQTGEPLFYYDIYRDYSTGYLHFAGNQSGFRGYVFDDPIYVPAISINGGTGLLTSNQTGTGNLVLATAPTISNPTLTTPTLGVAAATSIAIGGGTALTTSNQTGTGSLVLATSPTIATPTLTNPTVTTGSFTSPVLTTPAIGVATGTSLAVTGKVTSSSPTAGIGYVTGSGSTTTGTWGGAATINTITGQITMNNPGFSANTSYYVNVANSAYVAGATVVANIVGGATDPSQYGVSAAYASAGHFYICIRSYTAVSETLVFQFTIMLGATS